MSRTVSARIPKEMHEEIRERCNKAGCTINDWIVAAIDYLLTGSSEFDFGNEEELDESSEPNPPRTEKKVKDVPVEPVVISHGQVLDDNGNVVGTF